MKLFLSFLLLGIPLMCSKGPSEAYTSNDYVVDSEVLYNESLKNDLTTDTAQDIQQKLIKESYLRFETKDLNKTYLLIQKAINKNNGYIQDDNSNKSYNTITRRLIVRIPTKNFQNIIEAVSKDVAYFDTKRITSKDVTEEFIDIEARLKAKKTLEVRYLELLSKAKNVKDILEIERELSKIREDIEAKQGRLKYLENKVSLSTIEIEFYKHSVERAATTSYGSKMWKAITSGFDGLSVFFLGLLHIWPFIIILILLFFLIRKWIKKSKK
ncbi:hypothetical protein APS56_10935 [Pseudalgibacter alginicilyticus]|uniref:DUF4349 domain-containing protein n=1 Tax=Pseudalgibacter alginicilyticus TaxID=1736674 RepID=A0A0P0CYB4_9FLAO|nr:DUF4349 domain-containing protein [Pseudalgibacter alginicilyticus]ALJ05608.1 hypothetical protein APS56_10935 [Pseudalgibacter alginicilyticus]